MEFEKKTSNYSLRYEGRVRLTVKILHQRGVDSLFHWSY